MEGCEDYSETDHSGQAQIEAVPSAPALIIKALKQRPRNGKKKKKLSTMEIPLSKRLTTLLNKCGPDLSLENSVEPLKKSWGAPSLWAAMLMAATLAMASTVVQGMPS